MPYKRVCLLVGLGNPGKSYERTRHNIGFMVVDGIARAFSIELSKNKFDVLFGRGVINGVDVIIAKPMLFMNKSGPPIQKLAGYFNILCEDILVIHDDIDLMYERLKIKSKGGHGGHNGVRSLTDALGSGDFGRIRVGIGRPETKKGVVGHVLGKFSDKEKEILDRVIKMAEEATVTVICDSIEKGMNQFN